MSKKSLVVAKVRARKKKKRKQTLQAAERTRLCLEAFEHDSDTPGGVWQQAEKLPSNSQRANRSKNTTAASSRVNVVDYTSSPHAVVILAFAGVEMTSENYRGEVHETLCSRFMALCKAQQIEVYDCTFENA